MNRLRTTPILAALLALLAMLIFSSGAPAAPSAPLDGPTTGILDDFERPNENPLSGGGNWAKLNPASSPDLKIVSDGVESTGGIAARYLDTSNLRTRHRGLRPYERDRRLPPGRPAPALLPERRHEQLQRL